MLAGCLRLKRNSWRYLPPQGETDGSVQLGILWGPGDHYSLNDKQDVAASCLWLFVLLLFLICVGGCVDLLNHAFVLVNIRQINKVDSFYISL